MAISVLRGNLRCNASNGNTSLPHYSINVNIDGVCVFNNSEQAEIIPILAAVHSVSKSYEHDEEFLLPTCYPFIVGVFHGKTKPNVDRLCEAFLSELKRLDPANFGNDTEGRQCTVSLRSMICDSPMRTYLKKCKGTSGYWSCERCQQKGTKMSLTFKFETNH